MERVIPGKKIPRNPKKAPRTDDGPRLSARAPRYTATKELLIGYRWGEEESGITIEVWPRESLDDSKTKKEVTGRNPSGLNDIFTKKGNNDRPSAEYNGSGKVHIRKQVELQWRVIESTDNHQNNEGD